MNTPNKLECLFLAYFSALCNVTLYLIGFFRKLQWKWGVVNAVQGVSTNKRPAWKNNYLANTLAYFYTFTAEEKSFII